MHIYIYIFINILLIKIQANRTTNINYFFNYLHTMSVRILKVVKHIKTIHNACKTMFFKIIFQHRFFFIVRQIKNNISLNKNYNYNK